MTTPDRPADDREIVVTRLLDAPRDLVFRLFTEPEHVVHWWGPFGFRNSMHEMSVQPGGVWRMTMHGPDGTDYPSEIRFTEVVRPERLAYRHGTGVEGATPLFDVTITLVEEGGKTRMTLRQRYATEALATEAKKFAIEGGAQTFTRLAGYLAASRELAPPAILEGAIAGSGADDLVITRAFDAPRALVWEVMTQPAHLARWFGPAGMGLRVASSELKAGGHLHYAMKPGPEEMYGRFVYREVVQPSRLSYVVSFTDAKFEPIRHPLSATWPLEVLAINSLVELGKRTLFTGRSLPLHATKEERETFRGNHAGMNQGFKGTYDQLEAYLKTLA